MSAFILAAADGATSVIVNGYVVFNRDGQALTSFSPNKIEWSKEIGALSAGYVFNDHMAGLMQQLAESSDRFAESPIAVVVPVSKECITGTVEPSFDPLVICNFADGLSVETLEKFLPVARRVETLHRDSAAKAEWEEFLIVWALTGLPINGV